MKKAPIKKNIEETKQSDSQKGTVEKPNEVLKTYSTVKQPKIIKSVATTTTNKSVKSVNNTTCQVMKTEKKVVRKVNTLTNKTSVTKQTIIISNSSKSTTKLANNQGQQDLKQGAGKQLKTKKKGTNLFSMINKNIIQTILAFLNPKETYCLAITSKSVYELTRQGAENTVNSLQQQKQQLQQTHNLSDQQIKAIIYLKHFHIYNVKNGGYFSNHQFNIPELRDLIYTLWLMVAEKESRGEEYLSRNYKDETFHYYTHHNRENAKKEQIPIIDQCLSKYTDAFVEKGKLSEPYKRNFIILMQKYLKGMRLYLELNFNEEIYSQLDQIYGLNIFEIDKKIYFYQSIFGQKKEFLEVFKYNSFFEQVKTRKIKDIAHRFFH